jgi:GTP cyclohydrolase I
MLDNVDERKEVVEYHIKEILEALDEPLREGLAGTPERVARMYMEEIYRREDPLAEELNRIFPEETEAREMIVVRDVPFASWCEHHLIPYYGRAHVGYVPSGKLIGLSKIARLVTAAGKGLTIQERVTDRVADAIDKVLKPSGVVVVIEATHTCMVVRGARAIGSNTVTSAIRGLFRDSEAARAEFYALAGLRR